MMKREDPPKENQRSGRKGVYTEEAQEMRDNPRVWFVFREWKKPTDKDKVQAGAMANAIKHGRYKAFRPDGAFDGMRRLHEDGTIKVHARYNGADTEQHLLKKGTTK